MKYYLIAGEASGDMHGANLMKALQQKDAAAEFRFWGGDNMKAVGGVQVEHYKNTAFMGFWEVVTHLPTIFGFLDKCKTDLQSWQPDVLILIDYPGFNLRIAEFAKKEGLKVVYYISPQVWAWKENRVKKIKKYVDKMLVILPFEQEFYQKWQYPVEFVGHPLVDEIKRMKQNDAIEKKSNQIALLPGSRRQEISKILPEFLKVVPEFSSYQFVVAGLNHIEPAFYQEMIGSLPVTVRFNQTYTILQESTAALVASGTATLETALFKVPMVVGYKGSWLSYQIGKMLVDIEYISLVNLIMKQEVVKELIQGDLTEKNLKRELNRVLRDPRKSDMLAHFEMLIQRLGESGASEKAAASIWSFTKP